MKLFNDYSVRGNLRNDLSSTNVCKGAFQIGPCKKHTKESKTQESSLAMIVQ